MVHAIAQNLVAEKWAPVLCGKDGVYEGFRQVLPHADTIPRRGIDATPTGNAVKDFSQRITGVYRI